MQADIFWVGITADGVPLIDATAGSGLPEWLAQLGPLGLSAIVGGGVVAGLNHLLTARRERGAWLRELQVKANQDFYQSMQDVIDLIGHPVLKALHFRDENDLVLVDHADKMEKLLVDFGDKWADLMMVAEERTKAVATVVIDTLPTFAQLAIPLPGAVNRASRNQAEMALAAMTGLSAHMLLVMRKDVGLLGWRQWRTRWELRFNPAALKLAKARSKPALDLTEDEEPGGAPTPFELLQFWEVKQLSTNDTPASVDGYYADNDPYEILTNEEPVELPAPESQAILIKAVGVPWRFGMTFGLAPAAEQKLMRDVCLIVTGHNRAFEPELRPYHSPMRTSDVWLWKNLEVAADAEDPQRG